MSQELNKEWTYMSRRAVRYLSRFPSSEARFRTVMSTALKKRIEMAPTDTHPELVGFIDTLTTYVTELGYLDDRRLAEGLLNSYRRRGEAQRLIRQKLKRKGIPAEIIADTLADHTEETELASAVRYVEKKRLAKDWGTLDYRGRQRILQRLARRGFSYGIATKALEMVRER